MAATNEDCPIQNVIETEVECIVAGKQQGGDYQWSGSYVNMPAGCFMYVASGNTYFNTNIDPSSTSPSNGAAGLCVAGRFGLEYGLHYSTKNDAILNYT